MIPVADVAVGAFPLSSLSAEHRPYGEGIKGDDDRTLRRLRRRNRFTGAPSKTERSGRPLPLMIAPDATRGDAVVTRFIAIAMMVIEDSLIVLIYRSIKSLKLRVVTRWSHSNNVGVDPVVGETCRTFGHVVDSRHCLPSMQAPFQLTVSALGDLGDVTGAVLSQPAICTSGQFISPTGHPFA